MSRCMLDPGPIAAAYDLPSPPPPAVEVSGDLRGSVIGYGLIRIPHLNSITLIWNEKTKPPLNTRTQTFVYLLRLLPQTRTFFYPQRFHLL